MRMTTSERRSIFIHSLTPDTPMCVNCVHYYEHYSKDGYRFSMGHCCYPRLKPRRDYDTCEYFQTQGGLT